MLLQMGIRNFALIEQMRINFREGITIFTGETGSGKSILMDAFSILLGERANSEFIRYEKDSFIIEGVFDISHNKRLLEVLDSKNILVEDGQLILSRSFNRQGKSTILANDQPIPLKALKEIGQYLADIHGQYSNQLLLDPTTHHEYLDTYTEEAKQAYEKYHSSYAVYKNAKCKVDHLTETMAERARELDILRFQIDEIEAAALEPGEDISIRDELKRLDSFEYINKVISSCYHAFYEGETPLLDVITSIQSEIQGVTKYDDQLATILDLMNSAYVQLEEAAQSLDRYGDTISFDEERYVYCQERDSLLYALKKKYGITIEEIQAYEERAQSRLEELEKETYAQETLEEELALAKQQAETNLLALCAIRQKNADSIAKALQKELSILGMEKARLEFSIDCDHSLTALGANSIELLFSANTGEVLLPLHKVASGGELARIALAFKSVFSDNMHKTLVFDEIDVGISGDIALRVAERIQNLSSHNQIFCITHLPQTASITLHHYHLSKMEKNGRTYSTVKELDKEEHLRQIACMMSGKNISHTAMETARELMEHFAISSKS